MAKNYNVPYPTDFRTEARMTKIAEEAAKIKIAPFVPSDKASKEMAEEVDDEEKKEGKMEEKEPKVEEEQDNGET